MQDLKKALTICAVTVLSATMAVSAEDARYLSSCEVVVIDGDTLILDERTIRLHGIDAPEINQYCGSSLGPWSCGAEAKKALKDIVSSAGAISCAPAQRKRYGIYGREIAVCFSASGLDINRLMVRLGVARAYEKYSMDYVDDESLAKEARRGIWKGTHVPPWRWRRGERR